MYIYHFKFSHIQNYMHIYTKLKKKFCLKVCFLRKCKCLLINIQIYIYISIYIYHIDIHHTYYIYIYIHINLKAI